MTFFRSYFMPFVGAVLCCGVFVVGADELNIARPDRHAYVKPELGREGRRRADNRVNEARVYGFYPRQATYYLGKNEAPAILPSYPGLDAGKHGHWGKHNQNGHKDGRWNDMQHDGIVGGLMVFPKETGIPSREDAIAVAVDPEHKTYAAFSPRGLNFLYFWAEGGLYYDPFRWGTSRGAAPRGRALWAGAANSVDSKKSSYKGVYRHGKTVIFSYVLDGVEVLDSVGLVNGTMVRTIELPKGADEFSCVVAKPNKTVGLVALKADACELKLQGKTLSMSLAAQEGVSFSKDKSGQVVVTGEKLAPGARVVLAIGAKVPRMATTSLQGLIKGGPAALNAHRLETQGKQAPDSAAYVIDDVDVPFKNKQKSLMFLTGIDFTPKGVAYVSTLMGEIWKLTGLGGDLKTVTWQKVASGLNQPFGLRIWDGKIHVLERTRVAVLHDLNADGEFDFFENYNNEIFHRPKSHSHKFGLERDLDGNLFFVSDTMINKVDAKTRKLTTVATGLRNAMAFGALRDGTILVGPQEGTNTPTSSIFEVKNGDFYGHKGNKKLAPPMCYVPRGVDASTGGFYHVDDKRWGPLGKSIIGLSYGYGEWYQILRHAGKDRSQGATVAMDGQFFAGVVRAATNPVDGQLYTVGLDGWGDYSTQDGCLHRIRYTGKPLYKPVAFQIHQNGIRLDFPVDLDAASISAKNAFCQMWDYVNARQYGSPEYAVSRPDLLGHDRLAVTSVQLLAGGKSVFVEIPGLQPCMQTHLHLKMAAADGTRFSADVYPTVRELGPFFAFSGAKPEVLGKPAFDIRTKKEKPSKLHTVSGKKDDHARRIVLKAVAGMKYDQTELRAKAGESVALVLENTDGMPHNLVVAKPGAYQTVGMTAFKMLNDPKASEKHYVPKSADVVAHTFVVQPKGSHTVYFQIPKQPGNYPFLCTFPGHWQLMKGTLVVE